MSSLKDIIVAHIAEMLYYFFLQPFYFQ